MTRGRLIVRLILCAGVLLALFVPLHARELTIEERVGYQRAIEQVYWNHRTWPATNPSPKPPLSSAMPDAALRAKVEDYLQKSKALEKYWQRPVTTMQLQAEMDRMARDTRDGATLRELFHALGDDPHVIAETLARQSLADRLIHNWYANDTRFHGDLKAKAEAALASCSSVDCMKRMSGEYRETTWKLRAPQNDRSIGASDSSIELDAEAWKDLLARIDSRTGVGSWSSLAETPESFAVTKVLTRRDGEIATATVAWPKRTFDSWWDDARRGVGIESEPLGGRLERPAVALSTCSPDTWTPTPTDYPEVRNAHTAVWTGSEMIVWGGYNGAYLNTGGRYTPATDSWTETSTGANVPQGRRSHIAVWTGTEMIVWGGTNGTNLNTGGRYNPSSDSWTTTSNGANLPAARSLHTALWTGTEMIVWGGTNGVYLNTGGRYTPSTDSWTATSTGPNVPAGRDQHTAVWTGTQMIVWGGYNGINPQNTGGRYTPATDSWSATAVGPSTPPPRKYHTAIWTGAQMIIWGGVSNFYLNTGGRYDPSNDSWSATSVGTNVPAVRGQHTAVWTGTQMIVWGGTDGGEINTGGRYTPSSDTWSATSTGANVPSRRIGHSAVWTGNEMIVWGGQIATVSMASFKTGGRYDPTTDSWTPTSTGANVPAGRQSFSTVWTGTEMIVWGGFYGGVGYNAGGRYSPATNSWTTTSTGANVPVARAFNTAVWTGTEMIIWGGSPGQGYLNNGGRYNPSSDTWTPTSTGAGTPAARGSHTAVWTGTEMIVWGGGSGSYLNTGGRYAPSTAQLDADVDRGQCPGGAERQCRVDGHRDDRLGRIQRRVSQYRGPLQPFDGQLGTDLDGRERPDRTQRAHGVDRHGDDHLGRIRWQRVRQ